MTRTGSPAQPWGGRYDGQAGVLPLTSLIATVEAMTSALASDLESTSPDSPVLVRARPDDELYRWEIAEGHHSVALAIQRRRPWVRVVFDTSVDPEPSRGPFYDFEQHNGLWTGETALAFFAEQSAADDLAARNRPRPSVTHIRRQPAKYGRVTGQRYFNLMRAIERGDVDDPSRRTVCGAKPTIEDQSWADTRWAKNRVYVTCPECLQQRPVQDRRS